MECYKRKFADIEVGDQASFEVVMDGEKIREFARLTGDFNPLHVDSVYAEKTEFKGPIVHGMLVASFFSTLVGMYLPGEAALYLSQDINFRNPVRYGERLVVQGEVIQKIESLKTIQLKTTVVNQEGIVVLDGKAMVKVRD
jgi:acyl dehydratase